MSVVGECSSVPLHLHVKSTSSFILNLSEYLILQTIKELKNENNQMAKSLDSFQESELKTTSGDQGKYYW